MTLEELKAQLQTAGEQRTALQTKFDAQAVELQTVTASLATATATIEANADMVAAGTAYKAKLVDNVIQARRTLKMIDDSPEATASAKEFIATWPLAQIEAEAKQIATLITNPAASAIIGDSTNNTDETGATDSFRKTKED